MKQPFTGIVATVLIMAVSLGLISLFSFETFSGWLSFGLMCLIPAQIAVAVLWQGKHPVLAAKRRQPVKGILLILVTVLVGAIVVPVLHRTVGGGLSPGPMLVHCTVVSVVVMFWFAIIWGGWPFNAAIRNPVVAGLVTIAFSYAMNILLFRILFSYEFFVVIRNCPLVCILEHNPIARLWILALGLISANAKTRLCENCTKLHGVSSDNAHVCIGQRLSNLPHHSAVSRVTC